MSGALQILDTAALLTADAIEIVRMFQGPTWGIFLNGQPIVTGASVLRVGFARDARVADYPIEAGGFASYDKVITPYDVRLTFACGGAFSINSVVGAFSATSLSGVLSALTGDSARSTFLNAIDAAYHSLNLYTVMTPEVIYQNANVVHYDYERDSHDGATLLSVDVWLREIRSAPSPQFSNTKSPAAADAVNDGTVQTAPVTNVTPEDLPAPA